MRNDRVGAVDLDGNVGGTSTGEGESGIREVAVTGKAFCRASITRATWVTGPRSGVPIPSTTAT